MCAQPGVSALQTSLVLPLTALALSGYLQKPGIQSGSGVSALQTSLCAPLGSLFVLSGCRCCRRSMVREYCEVPLEDSLVLGRGVCTAD